MSSGRRRRRISPYRRIASTVGWAVGAAAVLAVVLVATGRSIGASVAVAIAGAAVVAVVVAALDLTGILRTSPQGPSAPDNRTTSDDDGSAPEIPRP
jgi:hypothetical protein